MSKIYYIYDAFSMSFRFITIFLVKCYHTKICAFEARHDCRHNGYGKELLQYILINYDDVRAVVIREALGFYRKCFFKVIDDNGGQVVTVEAIA